MFNYSLKKINSKKTLTKQSKIGSHSSETSSVLENYASGHQDKEKNKNKRDRDGDEDENEDEEKNEKRNESKEKKDNKIEKQNVDSGKNTVETRDELSQNFEFSLQDDENTFILNDKTEGEFEFDGEDYFVPDSFEEYERQKTVGNIAANNNVDKDEIQEKNKVDSELTKEMAKWKAEYENEDSLDAIIQKMKETAFPTTIKPQINDSIVQTDSTDKICSDNQTQTTIERRNSGIQTQTVERRDSGIQTHSSNKIVRENGTQTAIEKCDSAIQTDPI